ncbi:alpha-amylase family glycosyl hydrolase [Cryptosporangium phraense]|uniref:Alpha-amylase n=1 Tax=Cryptosporangium phraense TaxID=2593070 RepID=A0A545ARR2_9ACTN|nr:alpha-amylase family glycosyl hydrolase [Cryptosporangium phraense]TQS43375.1 alpha-amylase [Cryptosporangium phraense]
MTVVYEINTAVWLTELGGVGLGEVPAQVWDAIAAPGIDAVWLMGVWERSPAGRTIALRNEDLVASFRAALPDLRDDDVFGSPYCVRDYVVDDRLGGPDGLAAARRALAARGVKLILDYVPNHVAPDHRWLTEHPEYLMPGDGIVVGDHGFALGRDPFFPPWPDVVQLDAFSPGLRSAAAETLTSIGAQCDGVRCDMAMLFLNDVFARTWNLPAPAEEFWPEVIGRVRADHPDMLFLAEAYWGTEPALLAQGFDHCYDKTLYDHLVHADPRAVRVHLGSAGTGTVRFLENHDEPRAAAVLPEGQERAAAIATATLPGVTLWHEGQFTGRRVHVPVFLSRRPDEPPSESLRGFYAGLLAAVDRRGEWQLLACEGWPDNPSAEQLLAWSWTASDVRQLVVVNYADAPAQGRVRPAWGDLAGTSWTLRERLSDTEYVRDGDTLTSDGLYVALPGWGFHWLTVSR